MMPIVIAADSTIVRERWVRRLTDLDGVEVVGQAEDAPEARPVR